MTLLVLKAYPIVVRCVVGVCNQHVRRARLRGENPVEVLGHGAFRLTGLFLCTLPNSLRPDAAGVLRNSNGSRELLITIQWDKGREHAQSPTHLQWASLPNPPPCSPPPTDHQQSDGSQSYSFANIRRRQIPKTRQARRAADRLSYFTPASPCFCLEMELDF